MVAASVAAIRHEITRSALRRGGRCQQPTVRPPISLFPFLYPRSSADADDVSLFDPCRSARYPPVCRRRVAPSLLPATHRGLSGAGTLSTDGQRWAAYWRALIGGRLHEERRRDSQSPRHRTVRQADTEFIGSATYVFDNVQSITTINVHKRTSPGSTPHYVIDLARKYYIVCR